MTVSNEIVWWWIMIFMSLIFAGTQVAFVSSDKLRFTLDIKSGKSLNYVLNFIFGHPRQFLSTIKLCNTIVLGLIAYFSIRLHYGIVNSQTAFASAINFLIIILEIFLLILVTQEFLPRVIFQKHADFWVKVLAVPSFIFYILFFPLNRILISFSRFLLSLFGVKTKPFEDQSFEKEDLDSFVKMSMDEMPEENQSDPDVKIFRNALDFSTKSVKDCMVPRADIVAVSNDIGLEALKEKFIETGLSRILVYEDNIDNIIGYIHMWEMLNNPSDWTKRITPLSFVPESMSAKKLMSELMQEHRNMAVVVDEFGGTSGIVTLEDLVEEIFGEIEDEYDTKSRFAKREKDNEYVLSGRMEIDQVNEMFDLDLPESDDYTTVAGLVLHYTQRFPKTYETVEIGKFTFKILKVTARKIEVVRLIVNDNNKN